MFINHHCFFLSVGKVMPVAIAIRRGFLDRTRKFFHNPRTQTNYPLNEAIANGWIVLKSNIQASEDHQPGFTLRESASILSGSTGDVYRMNLSLRIHPITCRAEEGVCQCIRSEEFYYPVGEGCEESRRHFCSRSHSEGRIGQE